MQGLLVGLLFLCAASAQKILFLSLNEKCRDGAEPWICKKSSSCDELKDGLKNGTVEICSFSKEDPIVCCPPDPKNSGKPNQSSATIGSKTNIGESSLTTKESFVPGRKAEQKCREYSQYVYGIIENPVLLPGKKNTKIDECAMSKGNLTEKVPKLNEFPHMALLGMYTQSGVIGWFCGGSLISPRFILTAAHCRVSQMLPAVARLGDLDISDKRDRSRSVDVQIAGAFDHPQYEPPIGYHDISLVKLDRDLTLGPGIRPLCLQTTYDIDSEKAITAGWGFNSYGSYGSYHTILRKATIDLVDDVSCKKAYYSLETVKLPGGIKLDIVFCGRGGKDRCEVDSGGPLQIPMKDVYCMYSQIGVDALGVNCRQETPMVYTRVSNYVPWIESIVWP